MPQARAVQSWEDLFTPEEMETARNTDLPDLLTSLGYHVKKVGGYYTCQRRCDFVVFRRTGNVEKWRVNVYSF